MVPMCIAKVMAGHEVTIHADKTCTKPGSRFYIDAGNVADAILYLLDAGKPGEKYNIVGEREMDNLYLASAIAEAVGKKLHYKLVDFHSQRPGHDLRYALDGHKMAQMGWTPREQIDASIARIVKWTLDNSHWLVSSFKRAA
jgi:dTDP-glucose 4,6-dehydratase